MPPRPHLALPTPGTRRAVVVGAGSFGTATAVLLARGGFRTTLQTRTEEQARRLEGDRENKVYLEGVELPRDLRIEPASEGLARADYVFLGVPSRGLDTVIDGLVAAGLGRRTPVVSLAKGLVAPDGRAPTVLLAEALGYGRVACVGGSAHARDGHRGRRARRRVARRAPRPDRPARGCAAGGGGPRGAEACLRAAGMAGPRAQSS